MRKSPFNTTKAVRHLKSADARLGRTDRQGRTLANWRRGRPGRFSRSAAPLDRIYQQLNGRAASTIHGRVLALFPRKHPTTPAALLKLSDEDLLRGAGLSRNKLAALRDLAAGTLDGTVPTFAAAHRLSDEEVISRLTAVRGHRPGPVHMLLIFRMGRPDVLPTGDYAIRKGFQLLHQKRRSPSPELIIKHAESWRPYRSVASWYLWRSLD